MKIAIASGKGGTGKTTISVAMARSLNDEVLLLDCDVEEPNCDIFLQSTIISSTPGYRAVPSFDESMCTHCGLCAQVCQFNAIVSLKDKQMFFPELCHGCMGCIKMCPQQAINVGQKEIGTISVGSSNGIQFVQGKLLIGETMTPPLIKKIKEHAAEGYTIIDSPPGTSCAFVTAVDAVDFVVLVTEPTPFGVHDLSLAVDNLRSLSIPFAVVVNKWGVGDDQVFNYCQKEGIVVLGKILNNRMIAEAYSEGRTVVEVDPEYKQMFQDIVQKIETIIKKEPDQSGIK